MSDDDRIAGYKVHPAANAFPMMSPQELMDLAEDISTNGLRERLVIYQGQLLDGRNRGKACEMAQVRPETREYDGCDPVGYVVSMNMRRRHLNETQRAMAAARLQHLFADDAQARIKAGKKSAEGGERREKAALALNVSPRSVTAAQQVIDSGNDELIDACDRGHVAVSSASTLTTRPVDEQRAILRNVSLGKSRDLKSSARAYDKAKVVEQIKQTPPPSSDDGPYRVIAVDPPWKYDSNRDDGERRGETDYPPMELEEIKDLPVRELLDERGAIVWLWTTNAHLEAAFECLRAWELEYKTCLTWIKDRMGVGTWLRGQTEHCLVAVFAKAVVELTDQTTALHAAVREPGRKPEEFYALVEGLCPGAKLEMFARESREGWTSWGAEKTLFDEAG